MIMLCILCAILAQVSMVCGQILLKRAMVGSRHYRSARFAAAIACMTLYFFIWLGVAGYLPLSQLAPFDAMGPILLVATVHVALRERLSLRAWLGVGVILTGVTLIALS